MIVNDHHIPDTLCDTLIAEAVERYGDITPCHNRATFRDCLTYERGRLMLWINGPDHSTHIVRMDIETEGVLV